MGRCDALIKCQRLGTGLSSTEPLAFQGVIFRSLGDHWLRTSKSLSGFCLTVSTFRVGPLSNFAPIKDSWSFLSRLSFNLELWLVLWSMDRNLATTWYLCLISHISSFSVSARFLGACAFTVTGILPCETPGKMRFLGAIGIFIVLAACEQIVDVYLTTAR